MGSRDDQVQTITVDDNSAPDGGGPPGRPSLWVVGALLVGAIVVMVGVSRRGPPSPTTVPPVPEIETTTTTTTLPPPQTAFDSESALTWSPASGLTEVTHLRAVTQLGQAWYLAADTDSGSALYTSPTGIRWERLPVPTGPAGEQADLSYLVRVGTRLAEVGSFVGQQGNQIAAVWWSPDGHEWTMDPVPISEPAQVPSSSRITVDLTGAARAGGNLVVTGNVVFTTSPPPVTKTSEETMIPDWVPAGWHAVLRSSDDLPLSMSSDGVALTVDPFVVDYRTWDQLGFPYYRSSSYEMWVGYPPEPMASVPSPADGFRPIGTRPENGEGYGLNSSSRLLISPDGIDWEPADLRSDLRAVTPWQRGWVRTFDDRIDFASDGEWQTITPDSFLGPDWHVESIASSDLGIAGLAIGFGPATELGRLGVLKQETADDGSVLYTLDPGAGTLSVPTSEGGSVTFDLNWGDTFYVSPDGESTLIPTSYAQPADTPMGSVSLRGTDLVFGDGEGHELASMPAGRWTAAWSALMSGHAFKPDMALVHSPDGVRWSARRGSGIAGPLAEGIDSLVLADRFVLVRLIGPDAPPVWIGSGRPGFGG